MSRELARRLAGIILLAVFIAGGMGLQELDAVLYGSGHDSAPAGVAHLDPPGGCGAHQEHCVLAPSALVRSLATIASARVPVGTTVSAPTLPRTPVLPDSAAPGFLHTARPPPAAS